MVVAICSRLMVRGDDDTAQKMLELEGFQKSLEIKES